MDVYEIDGQTVKVESEGMMGDAKHTYNIKGKKFELYVERFDRNRKAKEQFGIWALVSRMEDKYDISPFEKALILKTLKKQYENKEINFIEIE